MVLIVVLATVGSVSVVVARTIRQGIGHTTLIGNNRDSSSPRLRTAKPAFVTASLTVAVFVPLLVVAYVAIGLIGHALGQ